ncbi:MAG: HAMP domain-containing histidine kinase [Myxococcales bacterium]|nr:HAMP domain-containing histidine kinase [Myxococcales bacterium]
MRRHLLIALICMVVGPLALLAALAGKMLQDEETLLGHRFRELLGQRLDDSRSAITEVIGDLEVELAQGIESTPIDREGLRAFERGQPLVRQVFVADAEGRRLHPLADGEASQDERDFLERTRAIWEARAELARVGPAEGNEAGRALARGGVDSTWTLPASSAGSLLPSSASPQAEVAQQQAPQAVYAQQQALPPNSPVAGETSPEGQVPAADSLAGLARIREQGWIAWYWEEGLHLLFWRRRADGLIAGAEIERAALLQRLIAALPATGEQASLIVVADAQGEPLYQWGNHEPDDAEAPLARLGLAPPLEAWALLYYGPEDDAPLALPTSRFVVLLGLGATAIVLLGLAVFFYREWSRNMREARERVSFVTQVSHELKTPLTNIRLYAELLADDLGGVDDAAEERAAVIVSESQRLSRLIANVLTFSRRGRPASERARPFDLDGLVRATVDHFGPAFRERGLEVVRRGAAPRPVLADEDATGQILANLLSNVEKYAAGGGAVEIEVEQDPRRTRVRVRDHGPGIPPGLRRRVFEPFFRARSDLTEGVSGTGIGLTIARDLARQQGGDLELVPADDGACFELTLPTAPETTDPHGESQR